MNNKTLISPSWIKRVFRNWGQAKYHNKRLFLSLEIPRVLGSCEPGASDRDQINISYLSHSITPAREVLRPKGGCWWGLNSVKILQFSSVTQSCPTVQSHQPEHARPPCPTPTPRVHPNPCPLSRWCHPTISSSVVPSLPAFNLS